MITKHNQREHAEKLHQCAKKLEGFYSCDNETFNGILYLLLQLRKVPHGDNSIMVRVLFLILLLQITSYFLFRIKTLTAFAGFSHQFCNQQTTFLVRSYQNSTKTRLNYLRQYLVLNPNTVTNPSS